MLLDDWLGTTTLGSDIENGGTLPTLGSGTGVEDGGNILLGDNNLGGFTVVFKTMSISRMACLVDLLKPKEVEIYV